MHGKWLLSQGWLAACLNFVFLRDTLSRVFQLQTQKNAWFPTIAPLLFLIGVRITYLHNTCFEYWPCPISSCPPLPCPAPAWPCPPWPSVGMFVLVQGEDTTRRLYYASCALTYLLAMVSSNMALQWVNYPTQVSRLLSWDNNYFHVYSYWASAILSTEQHYMLDV